MTPEELEGVFKSGTDVMLLEALKMVDEDDKSSISVCRKYPDRLKSIKNLLPERKNTYEEDRRVVIELGITEGDNIEITIEGDWPIYHLKDGKQIINIARMIADEESGISVELMTLDGKHIMSPAAGALTTFLAKKVTEG